MWNKIKTWMFINDTEIRWFFIGFFVMLAIHDFGKGNFVEMTIDLLLVVLNFIVLVPKK